MIWDLALHKHLRHGAARFDLEVQVRSNARRLALFGPSGAGKTQTLKLLAGLVRADDGRAAIDGRVLYDRMHRIDLSPQQRRLAYMFQDYALFPHLTLRQNIAFAAKRGWRNPRRDAIDERAEHWITVFGLQSVATQYPQQASGGQLQRAALARALVSEPAALLLDEPFAALDKALRHSLRDELRDLQSALSIPMLLITHDDDDLHCLADEVVEARGGQVRSAAAAAADATRAADGDGIGRNQTTT